MSNISGVKPQAVVVPQQPQKVTRDADGDSDGTKVAPPAPAAPPVAKPTATVGNHVNTTA